MENITKEFIDKAEKLFLDYKIEAEKNINLGNKEMKVDYEDAMKFVELFSVYSEKICQLANGLEFSNNDNLKESINSLSKQYILKYKVLFKFPE